MDINEAQTVIQAEADKLTAELHARGYDKAQAQIWLGHGKDGLTIFIAEKPTEFGSFLYGGDLAALLIQARERLAEMPDARAYDADFSAPLFLMSEQPLAQAAE